MSRKQKAELEELKTVFLEIKNNFIIL